MQGTNRRTGPPGLHYFCMVIYLEDRLCCRPLHCRRLRYLSRFHTATTASKQLPPKPIAKSKSLVDFVETLAILSIENLLGVGFLLLMIYLFVGWLGFRCRRGCQCSAYHSYRTTSFHFKTLHDLPLFFLSFTCYWDVSSHLHSASDADLACPFVKFANKPSPYCYLPP